MKRKKVPLKYKSDNLIIIVIIIIIIIINFT
jgi:hypothetical protein